MNDLYRALGDINSIRRQLANTTEFRGYGPATLAATGVFALVAGMLQELYVPDAARHVSGYLVIWLTTALLSLALTAFQMHTRARRIRSALSGEMMSMAVEQFVPSIAIGMLITLFVYGSVPQVAWTLPGLWQLIFSLGIFSSCRFLPRPMLAAGLWYMSTGLFCLAAGESQAWSPWHMAMPFAVGQLLVAAILRLFSSESQHES